AHVAREDRRGVGDGLAAAELDVARGKKHRESAELEHPGLEGDAGAGRGLLEDHREGLAGERLPVPARGLLDLAGQVEQPRDLPRGPVLLVDVIAFHGESLRSRRIVPVFPSRASSRDSARVISTRPPEEAKRAAASIFGPMLPGGNCPSSSIRRAVSTSSSGSGACPGFPKSRKPRPT